MDVGYFILYLFITIATIIYFLIKRNHSYWKNKGIPNIEPTFPFGNFKGGGTANFLIEFLKNTYDQYKNQYHFIGVHFFFQPAIIVTDLNLIKNILVKDFHNFIDRGMYCNEKDDPLSAHLFALDGKKWKFLRKKLTPTFTTSKMKFMYPTILEVSEKFNQVFGEHVDKGENIEIKELLARYTTDVIGTCAFGIECNSLNDPNAKFRQIGKRIFTHERHGLIGKMLLFTIPKVAKLLHMKTIEDIVEEFFLKVVHDTVEMREKNNIHRNDFLDLLINIKNDTTTDENFTIDEIAAQVFVFFLAGFETSSTTMGFCLYELAMNQDIQDKVRQEINKVLNESDGLFAFESFAKLLYMNQVIMETLRKYPPLPNLIRKSQADYQIDNYEHCIPRDVMCLIPIHAIHHDPDIYPEPNKFDPDRFTPNNIQLRNSSAWLAFGDGPRNCIGLRFGRMQTNIGLSYLIKNYKFFPSNETPKTIKFSNKGPLLSAEGGIVLKVEKI